MPNEIGLDLHGIKHENVKREVIEFIESHWYDDPMPDIIVITGHSEQMRKIVIEVIEEYQIEWEYGLRHSYLRILS